MPTTYIYTIIMAIGLCFCFQACSSDDDDITGTYTITSYGLSGCNDPSLNFSLNTSSNNGCSTFQGEEICVSGSIVINTDNTYSISLNVSLGGFNDNQSATGTYTLSGNSISLCEGSECFDANISGNSLTITVPEEEDCDLVITAEK